MKKVLIVAYEYPPLARVAIVKVLGTTRYLPEFGWEPTVLCARPGHKSHMTEPANEDPVTARIVVKHPPLAPFAIRVLEKLSLGARRGLILPDNYVDWLLPACWAGRRE